MTVTSQLVSWYKVHQTKKMLYIVFNQKNTPIMPALLQYYAKNVPKSS